MKGNRPDETGFEKMSDEELSRKVKHYENIEYNGPRNPDQGWKKDREHGRIGESTERGNKPWHEPRTARSSRQS